MQYTSLNCKYFTRCDPVILFESNVLTSLLFFFKSKRDLLPLFTSPEELGG